MDDHFHSPVPDLPLDFLRYKLDDLGVAGHRLQLHEWGTYSAGVGRIPTFGLGESAGITKVIPDRRFPLGDHHKHGYGDLHCIILFRRLVWMNMKHSQRGRCHAPQLLKSLATGCFVTRHALFKIVSQDSIDLLVALIARLIVKMAA